MADELSKDIVVDIDDWNKLIGKLVEKDVAVKDMLDKFIAALDTLIEDGFIQGTRSENMKSLRTELKKLRKQLDGICDSTKSSIDSFYKSVEFVDKYSSPFGLF